MHRQSSGTTVAGKALWLVLLIALSGVAGHAQTAPRNSQKNTKTVRQLVENFVEVYNKPGSIVYPLYADQLDWIEMPSGRRGGHDELMAALRGVRQNLTDLNLTVLSITADADSGVLESELHAMNAKTGAAVLTRVLWFFRFAGDKIVMEHDYSIAPAAPKS